MGQKVGTTHAFEGQKLPLVPLTGKSPASCGTEIPLNGISVFDAATDGVPFQPLVARPVFMPPKEFVLIQRIWAWSTSPKRFPPRKGVTMSTWFWSVMVKELHGGPMNMPENVSLRNCGESRAPKALSEVGTRLPPVQNAGPMPKS